MGGPNGGFAYIFHEPAETGVLQARLDVFFQIVTRSVDHGKGCPQCSRLLEWSNYSQVPTQVDGLASSPTPVGTLGLHRLQHGGSAHIASSTSAMAAMQSCRLRAWPADCCTP